MTLTPIRNSTIFAVVLALLKKFHRHPRAGGDPYTLQALQETSYIHVGSPAVKTLSLKSAIYFFHWEHL